MLYQWECAKNKYIYTLFDSNTSEQKIRNLFNKCLFKIFFTKTEFQNYNQLSKKDKTDLIEKYIASSSDNRKKNIYFRLASELSLYDVETKMHKNLYDSTSKKPLYKNVLLGRLGYIKHIRGDEDNIYRKLWNRYCKIVNSNKYKPLIIKNSQDKRLLKMINCVEEGLDIEFKEYYDKTKLLETVNSFLNSESGGQLIFGVKDLTKEIIGIDSELKEQKGEDGFRTKITRTITDVFKPKKQMNILCKFHKIYDKTICRIEVQPYSDKPILYDKNGYYTRQNSSKEYVQLNRISNFIYQIKKNMPF